MLTPVSGSDGPCWGSCCSSVSGEEQRPRACISRSCCKPGFVFPLPLLYSSCRRSRCCSPDTPSLGRLIARASFAPDLSLCINFSSAASRCCRLPASRGLVALPGAAFALGLQPRPLQASWFLENSLCRKLDREPDEVKNNTFLNHILRLEQCKLQAEPGQH